MLECHFLFPGALLLFAENHCFFLTHLIKVLFEVPVFYHVMYSTLENAGDVLYMFQPSNGWTVLCPQTILI